MIKELIYINFAPVLILLFLMAFSVANSLFDKKLLGHFIAAIVFCGIGVVAYSLDIWASTWSEPSPWRILFSAVAYSTRPLIVLSTIYIVFRGKNLHKFIYAIPAIINEIVVFSAFFTDIAYRYDEHNQYVRGPLGYTTHIVTCIYLVVFLLASITYFKERNYTEGLIVVMISITSIISTIAESFFGFKGFVSTSIAISITFYYLYLHTQLFKRDALTSAASRHGFYRDIIKLEKKLGAIISLDLNDLKYWNDNFGHSKGDEAICTIANCIRKSLIFGTRFYRMGGDEFTILCMFNDKEKAQRLMSAIQKRIASTEYSCAMGIAYFDNTTDYNTVMRQADEMMYTNKKEMKASDSR